MKRILLSIAFIILILQILSAQIPKDWGAFSQRVDAAPYIGKKFRLEASVKVQVIDSNAEGEIWLRIDKLDKKMGFFYNMMDKPIRLNEWKTYTISGMVDKNAASIYFGGLYHRKGIFYFDDFKFFVEAKKNKWQQIILPDGSFESDTSIIRKTWGFLQQRGGFAAGVSETNASEGKRSFKIDGSLFIPEETFGNNSHTGKYAFVNGIKIYYEEYGEGKPLLLLHGNSSSISLFEKQIPEFSKQFRVITVDTRGQGKSGEDGKKYTYDLFAEDMNALLDYLHLDSVNVVGWSDGGNTGLIMAMKYPAKVRRLVTMGANVFIDKTVVDKWVFKLLNKEKKELINDTFYNSRNRLRLVELLLTEPKHNFEELKIIKCPVLIVAGEKDIIKEEHTKKIAAGIINSNLLIASKETHYFPSENPKVFNAAVIDFFKK
jgi:pimeloyl-ACP methyl ester carboxylesterase